jgi:hypothetical protein
MTESDPHNAFVRRLTTAISAALISDGLIRYPERLNAGMNNRILNGLWKGKFDLTRFMDEETAADLQDIGPQFAAFFKSGATSDELDDWLTDRMPAISEFVEAYFKDCQQKDPENELVSTRDNVYVLPDQQKEFLEERRAHKAAARAAAAGGLLVKQEQIKCEVRYVDLQNDEEE